MGKKLIIAIVLLLPAFVATTAVAATTSVKVYCPCQNQAPLVLAPIKRVTPAVVTKPVSTTYVINNTVAYVRRPDPNDVANAYNAQHQYVNTSQNCNYYGYDCAYPASNNNYSYVRQPDPNDIANAYYGWQPSAHQYGCDYYGRNCVNPSSNYSYTYVRQPDPNDTANAYYPAQPTYYYANTPQYDYYPHRY